MGLCKHFIKSNDGWTWRLVKSSCQTGGLLQGTIDKCSLDKHCCTEDFVLVVAVTFAGMKPESSAGSMLHCDSSVSYEDDGEMLSFRGVG